jgi:hypothetical protein
MSLKFTVAEETKSANTQTVLDLCDYLSHQVVDAFCAKQGGPWDSRFQNFFSHDVDCNPFEATGIIEFRPPGLFAGQIGGLENAIRAELMTLNIKFAEFEHVAGPHLNSPVIIRIRILDNPTAKNGPPEVTMSNTAGCVVLRDLLGVAEKEGQYVLNPVEVLQKVSSLKEEQIDSCTAAPVRDEKKGVRLVTSPTRAKAIHRCLAEIAQFARWAVSHHYQKVMAS